MCEIIKVDFGARWTIPVKVKSVDGFPDNIRGPEEAFNLLSRCWPVRRSLHYQRARRQCVRALLRKVPADMVRHEFVVAGREADMLA